MKIRDMKLEDCSQVAEIEKNTFSVPWSREDFEGSILQENYCLLVATDDDDSEILGYCTFYHVLDEAEIPNVCVRAEARRQKVGETMMKELVNRAKRLGVGNMYLEVRKSNVAAKALYEKIGFADNGIRKNFYEFPTEDAVIMRLLID